jgi:hypothetical protein
MVGWKAKLISLGGRFILLNAFISNLPIYWLSILKLPIFVKKRFDNLRKRFLWFGGSSVRKKYYLVAWKVVCTSKQQGGLGIKDLGLMNKALLGKWLWREVL